MRRWGFGAFLPPGYFSRARSSETEPAMITSSPGFQLTGLATRRRGNPRPCRDRNRHQNSHAQSRSVRTPDGRTQGDQSRSVGSLDGKSRGETRSSSIGQIRRKLRQAIPSPMGYPNPSPLGYPNPSPMHNTGHTQSNTLENNRDSLVSER